MDTDAKNVAAARSRLSSLGLYGQVSVAEFDGKNLPYADDLVNLIVAESPLDVSFASGRVLIAQENGRLACFGEGE